jgi:hypothetical protein
MPKNANSGNNKLTQFLPAKLFQRETIDISTDAKKCT